MRHRRTAWLPLLPALVTFSTAVLVAAGCGDDGPIGCRIAQTTRLPLTMLTDMADVRMDRAADGFVLIGNDGGDTLRFARMSITGEVVAPTTIAVPAHTLGPYYAVTGKIAAGDQLLVIYGVADPAGGTALQLLPVDASGTQSRATPHALTDGAGTAVIIPAGSDLTTFQAAMGSSTTGKRAVFTWGFTTHTASPSFLLLAADGMVVPPASALGPGLASWDCLAVTPSRKDFGISRLARPAPETGNPTWEFFEMSDDGVASASLAIELSTKQVGCPTIAPTSKGYTVAWQNRDGTYFSNIDNSGATLLVTADIVEGAVRFGGPDRQPRVACVAPMGKEFSIVYDAATGAQVHRFDVFGNGHGGSLSLPSRGRSGPVTGWPGIDAAWVSYFDRGPTAADDVRYYLQIACPALD